MTEKHGRIESFTDLIAWQEAHRLVLEIYRVTESFPKSEVFGLTNQLRRAAVSITSNIADGFGRQSYREKTRFYSIAKGSNLELQNQLLIDHDIRLLEKKRFDQLADQSLITAKLLTGLIRKSKDFS